MFDESSLLNTLHENQAPRSSSIELEKLGKRVDRLLDIVQAEVASWTEGKPLWENRREHRQPYEGRLLFIPVDDLTEQPTSAPCLAQCKDISASGLKFCHRQPISHRKLAVQLIDEEERARLMIVSLRWTRFTKEKLYHSGAKVVRTADFEIENDLDFESLPQW